MKLRIKENFDVMFTPDFGTDDLPLDNTPDMYEGMKNLGYMFTLASNDVHTVHVNACGPQFTRLHEIANTLYDYLADCADSCFEIGCEDGGYVDINNAASYINWQPFSTRTGYNLETGIQVIINTLHTLTSYIESIYNVCASDIQSTLDEWTRYLNSQMNYFLKRIQGCDCDTLPDVCYGTCPEMGMYTTESMMLRNTRHDRKSHICERLENLKLGQSYVNWCQVEDFIEDYNCDTVDLKKGDYIIRDFQFGHLPNGGNKGYIPYKVEDIEYDRDDHVGGYWDARKRLHLYDGYEDFYIEVYNERFNGMFHKLMKSSVKE